MSETHENSPELKEALEKMAPICSRRDLDTLTLLVQTMVRSVVDQPDAVEIHEMRGERNVIFEVKVADGDHKYLLGSNGSQINAMRKIIIACARKLGVKVDITDVPQSDSQRGVFHNEQERQRWQRRP